MWNIVNKGVKCLKMLVNLVIYIFGGFIKSSVEVVSLKVRGSWAGRGLKEERKIDLVLK